MRSDHYQYIKEYVDFLRGFLSDDTNTINVVFDCSNGATGPIIERLFPDSIIINGRPDGNFPNHAPDPLHKGSLIMLQKKTRSEGCDVGVIFDADGDRVFFVDDRGRAVDPDVITYLLLWSLRPKRFISDIKTGWLIKKDLFGTAHHKLLDIERNKSKTGHYFIKKAMRKWNAEFGHEESGHYYFKEFFYCDSGIMTVVEVLNALAKLPYTLSQFIDMLPTTYKSAETNFSVPFALHGSLLKHIEATYKKHAVGVSKLDGITMEFKDPDWWFNVRFSNTEPLARLNMEARDKHVYDERFEELTALLKKGK